MPFDPVPWLVGGGAEHSPEVGRVLAFAAMGGNEGIIGSGGLRVHERDTPSGGVIVDNGACGIINRSPGAVNEMYVGRVSQFTSIPISPTGSTARTDLIVARVEDPFVSGSTYAQPSNVKTGPYIFPRVISGVSSSATAMPDGQSGIPLARITIPPNTTNITNAMITPLRFLANPRKSHHSFVYNPPTVIDRSSVTTYHNKWTTFPSGASWPVDIPSWATQVFFTWQVYGARVNKTSTDFKPEDSDYNAQSRMTLGNTTTNIITQGANMTLIVTAEAMRNRGSFGGADVRSVQTALRGTTQNLRLEHYGPVSNPLFSVDTGTSIVCTLDFLEVAE